MLVRVEKKQYVPEMHVEDLIVVRKSFFYSFVCLFVC